MVEAWTNIARSSFGPLAADSLDAIAEAPPTREDVESAFHISWAAGRAGLPGLVQTLVVGSEL